MTSKFYWESELNKMAKSNNMSLEEYMNRDKNRFRYFKTNTAKHGEWDLLWEELELNKLHEIKREDNE